MSRLYYATLFVAIFLFSACSDHFYAPVLYNNNASYQAKPLSVDSSKSANYVSGGVGLGDGIDNVHDYFSIWQLGFDRANTFQNFNIAYGVFGAAGTYGGSDLLSSNTKAFAAIGGRASVNLSFPLNNKMDLRIAGIDLSYSKEFGSYAAFRNSVINQPNYHVDNNNIVFSGGLTSELAWRGNSGVIDYAVRGYIGKAFGNHEFTNYNNYIDIDKYSYTASASFFMQINKKYCIILDKQSFVNTTIRFGYRF